MSERRSPSGSRQDEGEEDERETNCEEASGRTQHQLLQIRFDLSKSCTCCLCSSSSTSKSPLVSASDLDKYSGRRPWAKYRKVIVEAVAYRVPEGKLCLICQNVYALLGLRHKYGSYKQYHETVLKQKGGDHNQFMASLAKWVKDHNEHPQRNRVVDRTGVAKAKVKIKSEQSSGVKIRQER